jgi:putative selenate reductase
VDVVELIRRRARREFRVPVPMRPLDDRKNFKDIILTLSEADAKKEAGRCLDCHKMCSICVGVCPNLAIMTYQIAPFEARLPDLTAVGGRVARSPGRTFRVDQPFQVAVLTDFCNECGDCATFCPTAGRPYKDKPRLYLTRREFERERDNAFMVFRNRNAWAMQAKVGGATHEIVWNGDLRYNSPKVHATLDPDTFDLRTAGVGPACAEGDAVSLDACASMYVLLRGLRESMSHLPTAEIDQAAPLAPAADA